MMNSTPTTERQSPSPHRRGRRGRTLLAGCVVAFALLTAACSSSPKTVSTKTGSGSPTTTAKKSGGGGGVGF